MRALATWFEVNLSWTSAILYALSISHSYAFKSSLDRKSNFLFSNPC